MPNNGNKIIAINSDGTEELAASIAGALIEFRGKDSVVRISKGAKLIGCKFFLGTECSIEIESSKYTIRNVVAHVTFAFGRLKIGKDFSSWGVSLKLEEPSTTVTFGQDCMLSYGITIRTTDGHQILDLSTGNVVNFGADVMIGNHCWIGQDAMILKGVTLANGTIVAARSLVAKSVAEENTIIAGVSAKVVRRNVGWNREAPRRK